MILLENFSALKFLKTEVCESNGADVAILDECKFVDDSIIFKFHFNRPIVKSEVNFFKCFFLFSNFLIFYLQFMMGLYQIKDNQTRVFFKTPKLEWCSLVRKGQLRKFLALKFFLDILGSEISMLFQCPMPAMNATITKKIPQIDILPSGIYRIAMNAKSSDAQGETVFLNVSVLVQIEGIFLIK